MFVALHTAGYQCLIYDETNQSTRQSYHSNRRTTVLTPDNLLIVLYPIAASPAHLAQPVNLTN